MPSPLAADGIANRVHVDRVRLLYSLSAGITAAGLALALVVAVRLAETVALGRLVLWVMTLVALGAAGTELLRRFRAARSPIAPGIWERRIGILSGLNGLAWGALGLFAPSAQSASQELFLILVLGIVGMGVAGALAPSRIAFYAFVLPAFGVLWARFFGSADFAPGGWAIPAFLILLLALHDFFHRNLSAILARRVESELLAHEQQVIFDTAAEAICFIRDDRIVKCNLRFGELVGAPAEALVGRPAQTWFPDEESWRLAFKRAEPILLSGGTYRTVVELRRGDGSRFQCEVSGAAVDPDQPRLGSVWLGRDITEQLRTEAALRSSEERFRDLLSLSSDWYWEQDSEFRFTRVSGGVFGTGGLTTEAVVGKRRWEIDLIRGVGPDQWQAHREQLQRRQAFRDFIYQVVPPAGEPRWFSISGKPVFDSRGEFAGYHGVGSDITDRIRGAEQYRHLAHHDTLTGLPNRRLLTDRLEQAVALARRSGNRLALMLMDLDDFKAINDTHGHSTGDQVLVTVAQRLRASVRESDTVARLGGDEFVVLLQDVGQHGDAARIAEKVIGAVRQPLQVGSLDFRLGTSIGIALFPDHADNPEHLLQQADISMYAAKHAGGSTYRLSHTDLPAEPNMPGGDVLRH
jgi:diguanylate cyclase (GGDEF)-like protein/PAS domain S-box-containing protein